MNYWTQSAKNIFVAAHRGWMAKYPENTMEAFRAALTLDVDQLETDVRVTADGELVLIHDATVDRTTNGTGEVNNFTLAQLQALDAGSFKDPKFSGCRVPTMKEFMELVKDHPTITVDIELKEYPTEGHEEIAYTTCDRVLAMLEEYGFKDRCVINTWDGKLHEYIQDKYGDSWKRHVYFPIGRLKNEMTRDPYPGAYCTCVFSPMKGIPISDEDWELAVKCKEYSGVRLWAGTYAKDEESIDMAVRYGTELITCNNPDEVLEILRAKGLHK